MSKMKISTICLLLSIFINWPLANCEIEGYQRTTINNQNAVDADMDHFISLPTQNVVSAVLSNSNDYPYIDVQHANDVYTVKATDRGNPILSATAMIRIEVDESGSAPANPEFKSEYYTATYKIEGTQHSISDVAIPVAKGVSQENIQLSGGLESFFMHSIEDDHLKIRLKENLPDYIVSDDGCIALDIRASIKNAEATARTSLIISMPLKITTGKYRNSW